MGGLAASLAALQALWLEDPWLASQKDGSEQDGRILTRILTLFQNGHYFLGCHQTDKGVFSKTYPVFIPLCMSPYNPGPGETIQRLQSTQTSWDGNSQLPHGEMQHCTSKKTPSGMVLLNPMESQLHRLDGEL